MAYSSWHLAEISPAVRLGAQFPYGPMTFSAKFVQYAITAR